MRTAKIIYGVDAFTAEPFTGNPAGVCLLEAPAEDKWMQSVAAEMNLSETAFLLPMQHGWGLRWFTPAVEVRLCGHATLASAHILWQTGALQQQREARFETLSGILACRRMGEWIEMDFPSTPAQPTPEPPGLALALGTKPLWTGTNGTDLLVEIQDEAALRRIKPNFGALAQLPVRGIIVTCRSARPECDFLSRFFAPAVGVNEDPVTGSAHCALGPYWQAKSGRNELTGSQASARGGVVKVSPDGARVLLKGQAVTVSRIEFFG